jgi:two-component system CheB/CheR fusion protein
LKKFFVKEGNHYRVRKSLRETVLFAHHNVLRDPPFSRLDLISCRNLLIYLNRTTQGQVFEIFHFALHREGFLFLGSSESAESATRLFSAVDKKHRIYRCRPGVSTHHQAPAMPIAGKWQVKIPDVPMANHKEIFSFGELHYQFLERYAPPSVLINEDYDIVHLSENAGRFLRLGGGEPSRNLLKVVHAALRLDLRATLIEAKEEGREAESRHVPLTLEGHDVLVNLIVRPFEIAESASRFLLILFDEVEKSDMVAKDSPPPGEAVEKDAAMEAVVNRLENELLRTRDRLRATIEQHETSIEEHKASNEELQAINEELRSASEELETSKEELQSVNEELSTVNHELKDKIEEVIRANSDLQNFLASTDIGTIFLDRDLQIKRYTPRVRELFNIIPSDIGRPLSHLTHRLDYDSLENDAAKVLRTLRTVEREVHSADDHYYSVRFLPYRTLEDKIDGVVLTFIDITEIKRATDTVREREATIKMAQRAAKAGVWNLRIATGEAWWSKECYELYGLEADDQKMTFENWLSKFHANEQARVEAAIRQAVEKNEDFSFEVRVYHPTKGERWL